MLYFHAKVFTSEILQKVAPRELLRSDDSEIKIFHARLFAFFHPLSRRSVVLGSTVAGDGSMICFRFLSLSPGSKRALSIFPPRK